MLQTTKHKPTDKRYRDEIKQFALIYNFYFPIGNISLGKSSWSIIIKAMENFCWCIIWFLVCRFSKFSNKCVGFIHYGNVIQEDAENIVSEALVLMQFGLKYLWTCSVGYVLTDVWCRFPEILNQILCIHISRHRLQIWSVTNLNTFKNLCAFSHNYDKIIANFKDLTWD